MPYPQAALRVIRDFNTSQPLPAAASLEELDAGTGDKYWYDTGTGMLHLKLMTRRGRTSATCRWSRSNGATALRRYGARATVAGMYVLPASPS